MARWMSDSKANEILAEVQLNPEINGDDSAFVVSIIQRAARFLTSQIHLSRYPELAAGYSASGASPSEDISSESNNEFLVSIDDGQFYTIELTLGSLTSGAAIATEMQTKIRAVGVTSYKSATVTFAGGLYTITSPTFGEFSHVAVSYNTEREDIAVALKLSPEFGGTEWVGGDALPEYDDVVVALVQHWYNKVGVEGMQSFSVPGSGSFTAHDIDPMVHAFIVDNRRLVV
jgi:hypothetical protein